MRLGEFLEVASEYTVLRVYDAEHGDELLGDAVAEYDGLNSIPDCLNGCEVWKIDGDNNGLHVTINATEVLENAARERVEGMTDKELGDYGAAVWDAYNEGLPEVEQWDPEQDDKEMLLGWLEVDPAMAVKLLDVDLWEI